MDGRKRTPTECRLVCLCSFAILPWTFGCPWRRSAPALEIEVSTQSSGAVWTWGRWSWALIPYPILPPSLISHMVSVDVKQHEWNDMFRFNVNRWWAGALIPYPISPPSLMNHTVSAEVKHHEWSSMWTRGGLGLSFPIPFLPRPQWTIRFLRR